MRISMRAGITAVVCGALLLGAWNLTRSRGESPRLANSYGDLADYWEQVATSIGIKPSEGLLQEWRLNYGDGGVVSYLRLVLYVDQGEGRYDVYVINQNETSEGTWRRNRLARTGSVIAVPAQKFFTELNSVGYRRLETHQATSAPIRSWFRTISGTITYGPLVDTLVILGGRILPAGADGVTMSGPHGAFQMVKHTEPGASSSLTDSETGSSSTATRPGDSPPFYVLPDVGCSPKSSNGSEVSRVWSCPSHRP
jgi:hypothetical protein